MGINIKICDTTPWSTTKIVNVNIGFVIDYYLYLVVTL